MLRESASSLSRGRRRHQNTCSGSYKQRKSALEMGGCARLYAPSEHHRDPGIPVSLGRERRRQLGAQRSDSQQTKCQWGWTRHDRESLQARAAGGGWTSSWTCLLIGFAISRTLRLLKSGFKPKLGRHWVLTVTIGSGDRSGSMRGS